MIYRKMNGKVVENKHRYYMLKTADSLLPCFNELNLQTNSMRAAFQNGKFIHMPNTKDYIRSLGSMLRWCDILYENSEQPYRDFLKFLIENKFYTETSGRLILKDLANAYGIDTPKATKWLKKMYEDLIHMNEERPHLFKTAGTRHDLSYRYFDSYGYCTIFLEQTPALHDGFIFPFAHAAVGTERFYVDSLQHYYDGSEQSVSIDLVAGVFANRYRELLIDRAIYFGVLSSMDKFSRNDSEIDEKIKRFYKH